MQLEKYSMGVGDRFGQQGRAQLQAMQALRQAGVPVVPVWNKSFREHSIIHTQPMDVRRAADAAVAAEGWTGGYHVDADHIRLETVDRFIAPSDFFTIDVADSIGKKARTLLREPIGSLVELGSDLHRLATAIGKLPAGVDLLSTDDREAVYEDFMQLVEAKRDEARRRASGG